MRICVFGAGAIGGHLAGRLVKGGADVSVIARGAHLAAIRAHGLRVIALDGDMHARLLATDDPATLGPQDAVIVALKAPGLPSLASAIAPLLGPETSVTFMMNGIPWWYYHAHGGPRNDTALPRLDPGGAVQRAVGFARTIGGVVYSACTVVEPGVIKVENANNRFVLGEPDGTRSARIEALAAALAAGGVAIEITERIRDSIWAKLLLNLGSGPLGVLTASAPMEFYIEDACKAATHAVVAEAAAVAAAMGCRVSPKAEAQVRNGSSSMHKTSILQDLELGRPMEVDALYTVPLEMARSCNVPTPTLDLLAALTRARARAAGLYT